MDEIRNFGAASGVLKAVEDGGAGGGGFGDVLKAIADPPSGGGGGLPGGVNLRGGVNILGAGGISSLDAAGGLRGIGSLGGIGSRQGPPGGLLKTPGADRMDGDGADRRTGFTGVSGFLKGTWDFGSNGLQGSVSSGGVLGQTNWSPVKEGLGIGMNDRGEVGVADGTKGGNVTSPAGAQATAAKAFGGGGDNAAAPDAGFSWIKGARIIGDNKDSSTAAPAEPQINDLGPSTNEPEQTPDQTPDQTTPDKDEGTAVAQNDDPKGGGEAGKPNPDAMPADDTSSGGNPPRPDAMPADDTSGGGGNSGPRAVTALSTTFLKAGSTSASAALRASNAFTPNPEDSGGGGNSGPRSVTALSTTFLKAGSTSASAALRASNAFTPSITVK